MTEDDAAMPPEAKRPKKERSSRGGIGLGKPKITESLRRVTPEQREEARRFLPIWQEYADQQPKTRGDCVDGPRPCPWISCSQNLYLDVKTRGPTAGTSIIMNFPDLAPDEVPADRSCALDIADQGGSTLEDVAKLTNLTRERVRQVQDIALVHAEKGLKKAGLIDIDAVRPMASSTPRSYAEKSTLKDKADITPAEEVSEFEEEPSHDETSVSFISDHPDAVRLVTSRIWRIFLRRSVEDGHEKRVKSTRQKQLEAEGAAPLIDIPLVVAMTRRHKEVMAPPKKKINRLPKRMPDSLTDREQSVYVAYLDILQEMGRVPNNHEIAKRLKLSKATVGSIRSTLIGMKLAKPSPKGKTPARVEANIKKRKTRPNDVAKIEHVNLEKIFATKVEHQMLPDTVMEVAAEILAGDKPFVRAMPQGPVTTAANAIRLQLDVLDKQRSKLTAALNALSEV